LSHSYRLPKLTSRPCRHTTKLCRKIFAPQRRRLHPSLPTRNRNPCTEVARWRSIQSPHLHAADTPRRPLLGARGLWRVRLYPDSRTSCRRRLRGSHRTTRRTCTRSTIGGSYSGRRALPNSAISFRPTHHDGPARPWRGLGAFLPPSPRIFTCSSIQSRHLHPSSPAHTSRRARP
jgi:hypothetical protein